MQKINNSSDCFTFTKSNHVNCYKMLKIKLKKIKPKIKHLIIFFFSLNPLNNPIIILTRILSFFPI